MAKKVLGKGLESLIPGSGRDRGVRVLELGLDEIRPNPHQPRKSFEPARIAELAASIQEKGVVQPILVRRKASASGEYELIAGERRLRAAREAGLKKIPALIREASPEEAMEISLIENIQRQDLNPLEEAEAFQRLMEKFEFTQEKLAQRLGKERSTVANTLRLLKLPPEIKQEIRAGNISAGHARALLALPQGKKQKGLLLHIKKHQLSVREAEKMVESLKGKLSLREKKRASLLGKGPRDPHLRSLENELCQMLGTRVLIKPQGRGGQIQIAYYSQEDLTRLWEIFRASK